MNGSSRDSIREKVRAINDFFIYRPNGQRVDWGKTDAERMRMMRELPESGYRYAYNRSFHSVIMERKAGWGDTKFFFGNDKRRARNSLY